MEKKKTLNLEERLAWKGREDERRPSQRRRQDQANAKQGGLREVCRFGEGFTYLRENLERTTWAVTYSGVVDQPPLKVSFPVHTYKPITTIYWLSNLTLPPFFNERVGALSVQAVFLLLSTFNKQLITWLIDNTSSRVELLTEITNISHVSNKEFKSNKVCISSSRAIFIVTNWFTIL